MRWGLVLAVCTVVSGCVAVWIAVRPASMRDVDPTSGDEEVALEVRVDLEPGELQVIDVSDLQNQLLDQGRRPAITYQCQVDGADRMVLEPTDEATRAEQLFQRNHPGFEIRIVGDGSLVWLGRPVPDAVAATVDFLTPLPPYRPTVDGLVNGSGDWSDRAVTLGGPARTFTGLVVPNGVMSSTGSHELEGPTRFRDGWVPCGGDNADSQSWADSQRDGVEEWQPGSFALVVRSPATEGLHMNLRLLFLD